MTSPTCVVIIRHGKQSIIRAESAREADKIVFHNLYYGGFCLKVKVKEWK